MTKQDMVQVIAIPQRLRKVAGRLTGDSRKELLAIAATLESLPIFTPSPEPVQRHQKLSGGAGAAEANRQRSNEERIDEVVAAVNAAVAELSRTHNWRSLGVRQKIELLKVKTLQSRGVAISSQTLYRPWLRDLW